MTNFVVLSEERATKYVAGLNKGIKPLQYGHYENNVIRNNQILNIASGSDCGDSSCIYCAYDYVRVIGRVKR